MNELLRLSIVAAMRDCALLQGFVEFKTDSVYAVRRDANGAESWALYIWSELQERPATPFTHARQRLYIHHVAVKAEVRGSGVGTALLQASEGEARALGVSEAAVDTWAFNVGAQRFFEAADFAPINIVMRKKLSRST